MQSTLTDAAVSGTRYAPHAGPITLDTLDDLFASRRAIFAGFRMEEGDGDGDSEEFEVDGDGDDGDDDDGDDGDEGDEGDGDKDAPAKAALKKERDRVKELRRQLAEARAEKSKDGDGDDAEKKAEAKWKPRLVNAAAKTALLSAGAEKPERLLKLLDTDSLDVDDDGDVDGLDAEVDRLREEYPELFGKKRAGRRVETGDRSGGSGPSKKMTATERQAAILRGEKVR